MRPALGDQASHLTLHLGSDSFALAAATNLQATTFAWSNHGLSWANGDAVEATVTFSAAVDITGTPQLELDFDGTPKLADCATGTNTTTMACSYTVAVGDVAAGGIAIAANKLTLNGGTITATGSTTINAVLAHGAVLDRRRAQGRRHPPDTRHHRQRGADHVDRRHEGDPDVQREPRRFQSHQGRHYRCRRRSLLPAGSNGEPLG